MRYTGSASVASHLDAWLEPVLRHYAERVLPIEILAARTARALADRAHAAGHAPGLADIAIAATVLDHSLVVLNRNLRHFRPLQVLSLDPFDRLPNNLALREPRS